VAVNNKDAVMNYESTKTVEVQTEVELEEFWGRTLDPIAFHVCEVLGWTKRKFQKGQWQIKRRPKLRKYNGRIYQEDGQLNERCDDILRDFLERNQSVPLDQVFGTDGESMDLRFALSLVALELDG
jgi:hypothetical protein